MLDVADAWRALADRVPAGSAPEEEIAVCAAAGRVCARPAFAALSSPGYHGAAMDGYAVRSADTLGASEARPLRLGRPDAARAIDTGDALPAGFDAVIKVEDVHEPPDADAIEITAAVAPWHNVRLTGEDVVAGELVVPAGKRLGAYDVGALLCAGVVRLWVKRRPGVALLATGDELVEPGTPPAPGQVVEFNTRVLAALVAEWGGEARRLPPVRDDRAALIAALAGALEDPAVDVVALNAGSSAGRDDHTPAVLSALGELLVHGINIMPGKPTAVAMARGKPVLGLPGYPVSCAVAAERLLRPLLARLLGVAAPERERVRARVLRKVPSKVGHEEVLRVQVGRVGGGWVAAPLARGAGVITSLSRANALLGIPPLVEGLEAGQEVDVELLVPRAEAELTLVHVGSHDLALDLAGSILRRRHPGRSLASANVGSLAGLYALARGECHFAGTHLLDPDTGEYNLSYLRRACPGRAVALVDLVAREQGFTVARGNPKAIRGIADLARPDVTFVNRQRGAGTRVLLDARLAQAGVAPGAVRGYAREEHTHMAAAVAVASGVADCALTIRAAAAALRLDFVPLEIERYQLALPAEDLPGPHAAALLDTIASPDFRRAAEALGGYSAAHAGEVVVQPVPKVPP
jgi:molybdopterin molybdotransferase/putative molybdopterin biosynthesis protein